MPLNPPDRTLINANPKMYAATLAGSPTPEEQRITDNLQHLLAKDQAFAKMSDLGKAKTQFAKLDPEIQKGLMFLNPNAQYQQKPKGVGDLIREAVIETVKSPFKAVINTADAYGKLTKLQYKLVRGLTDTGKTDKQAFLDLLNKKTWIDGFEGHNQWDQVATKRLEAKHGIAMSALAKGLIDGKTPGDILREYGPLDSEMVNAIKEFSDQSSKYKNAFAEYKAYQINPGNDFTNWANRNHPPKDGGVWSGVIPLLLSASTFGAGEVAVSKNKEKWLIRNPNPLGKDPYVSPSGGINAAYTMAVDPLTWLTGGSSKAILKAEKLAEDFTNAAKAGVLPKQRVQDLFAIPEVSAYHEKLAPVINELRRGFAAKDPAIVAAAKQEIKRNFSKYDNAQVQDRLVNAKVLDDNEDLVPVTDLDTMQRFFKMGEHTNYLISGRTDNLAFYTEHHVALETRTRKMTDGFRAAMDQVVFGYEPRARDVIKPIPKSALKKFKDFEKYLDDLPGISMVAKDDKVLKYLGVKERNFLKAAKNSFGIMPKNVQIFHAEELVLKSIDDFRNYTRLIVGDKTQANLLAARYLMLDPEDRINLMFSLDKLYHAKIGLLSVPEGIKKSNAILEAKYAPVKGMGPVSDVVTPTHLKSHAEIAIPAGMSQILHGTKGVSMPNFNELVEVVHNTDGINSRLSNYLGLNGSINEAIMSGWSLILLYPKIALKGAVDEGTIGFMVNHPRSIYAFFNGKGRGMSRTVAGYTGDSKSIGPVKNKMLSWAGKNPTEYVSAAQRKQMGELIEQDVSYRLPNGKEIRRTELVSPEEYFGQSVEERISNIVLAKYAGKLTEEEKGYLGTFLTNNSHALDGMVRSTVAASLGNTMVDGTLAAEVVGKSKLTEAVDSWGRKSLGKFITDEQNLLLNSDRTKIQYDSFYKYFGKNIWTAPSGKVVDFGDIFIKHNALRTTKDGEAYVGEVLTKLGLTKNKDGVWKAFSPGDKATLKSFLGEYRQTVGLRDSGLTDALIAEGIVRKSMAELYTLFHGNDLGFNEKLLNALKGKVETAKDKIVARNNFNASDFYLRNYAGAPQLKPSAKQLKERAKYEQTVTSNSYHVRNTPYSDFEILVKDHPLQGQLKSDLDFPELITTAEGWYSKVKKIAWDQMDRQLTDLYRSDGFLIKLVEQRKIMATDEKQHVNDLMKQGMDYDSARIQADLTFDNRATENATNELMKYADNPDIRTQLAWNLRTVGRFYRATEDYSRRLVRYLDAHPDKVFYRLSQVTQGMNGSGIVYTDNNNTSYVLIPNDGIAWRVVAPVFAALMNPLYAGMQVGRGNWDYFKQPAWNQATLKISLLNPSYAEGSGMPTLTGPTMALPVLGAKQLLNTVGRMIDQPNLVKVGENLDNYLLGEQSDNTTWARALFPPALNNAWNLFATEHKTGIEATTLYQAAAYLQSNPATALKPEDSQNREKLNDYLARLRLAAHNIVAIKMVFNTISAAPIGSAEPNIPSELRKVGVVGLNQQFSDILRAVLDVNSQYGYNLEDPIGTAVQMFIGSNPDKLIWTVSKNSQAAKQAINYSKETKNWAIENNKMLSEYAETGVGWVFAPNVGKYDPSVANMLAASDLITGKDSPFEMQGAGLKRYLQEISVVKARQDFYNVDREVQQLLNDPNNLDRNRADYRAELLARARVAKESIKIANPLFKETQGTENVIPRQQMYKRYNEFSQLVQSKEYASLLPEGPRRKFIDQILPLANRVIAVLEDPNIRFQFNGQQLVDDELKTGLENLKKYSGGNPILTQAFETIIRPLINDIYVTPTKVMGK